MLIEGDIMLLRENYLSKIRGFYDDSEMIKVITRIIRSEKSTVLGTVKEELIEKNLVAIPLTLDDEKNTS